MSTPGKFGYLVGAIDEGTSSARFLLFRTSNFEIIASHQEELKQIYPQEGWVEQDPREIMNIILKCINKTVETLIALGGSVKDIIAVGVTNQRETTIVWDKQTGEPLYNAIVWLDMRTSVTVEELLETVPNQTKYTNYLKPLCGLPLSPYFSGVKLRWLKDKVPKIGVAMKEGTCLFGTVDTWIIWNLTGGANGGIHITDVTNASRTMLMNIETLKWDELLLKFFQVPASVLPAIRSSSEIYGHFSDGPLKGIPLSGCLGDQQAALVGQSCLKEGQAKATFGTGCFVLYNTGKAIVQSSHGLLTTVAFQLGQDAAPCYALEGSVAVAGAAITWLRDNMKLLSSAKDSQKVAESATDEGSVVFVPAFSGLYAPYWRKDARGVIWGITYDTESKHIVKATLDAVCFQVRDILDAMNNDCGIPLQMLQVDGGMTDNDFLMQTQSDFIGIDVIKAGIAESTSLGAALAALWAVDPKTKNDSINIKPGKTFSPKMDKDLRDMKYNEWKMGIERALSWEHV